MLLFLLSEFFLQLLRKYALKGLKSSLIDISWLLDCPNGLLVNSRISINRGSTQSSSFGRLNSLRRLRLLCLFFDRSLNCIDHYKRFLLRCAFLVIRISHLMLVWLRIIELNFLFFLDDGGIISRRGSTKVDRLVNQVAYLSNICVFIAFTVPPAGLPIL